MNWDRKELKAKGKAAYQANRVTCIIAALLLFIVAGGGGSVGSAGSSLNLTNKDQSSYTEDYDFDDGADLPGDQIYEDIEDIPEELLSPDDSPSFLMPAVIIGVLIFVLIAIAAGMALAAFLLNPVQVGLRKFFLDNSSDPHTGLNNDTIGLAFSNNNYMKIVGSMFTTSLFTFLWCLLLVIPGIYKSYCWRLVPYIIAEDPAVTGKEARARSAEMMDGSKWRSFVLDLSFIGWYLLGVLTLGILNLLFTSPYQAATDAELYIALSGKGAAEPAGMQDAAESEARHEGARTESQTAVPVAPENSEPVKVVEFDIDQENAYDK